MKKFFFAFGFISLAAALSFQSCDKIKDEIVSHIDPFTYSQTGASFDIPAQPILLPLEYNSPEQTEFININQVIKDNAGLDLNINDFSYIKLIDATFHLTNGTEDANWTNIDYAEVQANTDKGLNAGKPWLVANISIPNDPSQKYSDKMLTFPDQNLKDYLDGDGTVVHYKFKIKPRAGTATDMHVEAIVRYEFKP